MRDLIISHNISCETPFPYVCSKCKSTDSDYSYPNCKACNCYETGSQDSNCDAYGRCKCKETYTGPNCDQCRPWYIMDSTGKCVKEGAKILIATGSNNEVTGYGVFAQNTEIIDLEDSSFSCNKVMHFPIQLRGATGALIDGVTPFICGGIEEDQRRWLRDCYTLSQTGIWTKSSTASLKTARRNAGFGSVVFNREMVLSGGRYGIPPTFESKVYLTSIELVSPEAKARNLSVELPIGIGWHCQIPWDSETFMVIGGYFEYKKRRAESYFINVKTETRTLGPSLQVAKSSLACGELEVLGKSYIVAAGGFDGEQVTEVLDKSDLGQGWQRGK